MKISFKEQILFTIILFGILTWLARLLVYFNIFGNNHTSLTVYFGDFDNLYRTSVQFLETGKIYGLGYAYPPLSFLLFSLMGLISRDSALIVKIIIDIICYSVTLYFIVKILKSYDIYLSAFQKTIIFFAMLLFYPVSVSFAAGAINAQILVLTTIIYYLLFIKKDFIRSSIFICIATIIKIIPFDLILLNKKLQIKTILLFIFSFILSLIFFGLNTHIEWLKYITVTQYVNGISASEVLNPISSTEMNDSISLFIYKFVTYIGQPIVVSDLNIILLIIKIIIIIYLIYFIYNHYKYNISNEQDILYFSFLIFLPLLLSNTTWIYYFVFMMTPIFLWIFILKLTKFEKILLFISILLISSQGILCYFADLFGGNIKIITYMMPPATLASVFLFTFIWRRIE